MSQTTSCLHNLWSEIMELSSAMLYHGEKNNWKVVARLESSRKKMLTMFFNRYDMSTYVEGLYFDITKLLELNKKLLAMAKQTKCQYYAEFQGFKAGKIALEAYGALDRGRV